MPNMMYLPGMPPFACVGVDCARPSLGQIRVCHVDTCRSSTFGAVVDADVESW